MIDILTIIGRTVVGLISIAVGLAFFMAIILALLFVIDYLAVQDALGAIGALVFAVLAGAFLLWAAHDLGRDLLE